MTVRFFGQFVVDEGVVSSKELQDALELMYWVNRSLGELAAASGYMTRVDVERIRQAQLASDARFGELAIQAGYLDEAQVRELLVRQQSRQLQLGDALVELGFLSEENLVPLLERFEREQAPWRRGARQLAAPLEASPLAQAMLALVPRYALRIGRLPVKFGAYRPWDAVYPDHWVMGSARAGELVHVGLVSELDFARALSDGGSGDVYEAPTSFLASLARQASEPAALDVHRDVGLPEDGIAYELASVQGRAQLIFRPL